MIRYGTQRSGYLVSLERAERNADVYGLEITCHSWILWGRKTTNLKLLKQLLAQRRAAKGQTRNKASAGLNSGYRRLRIPSFVIFLCVSTGIPFVQLLPAGRI